MGWLSLFLWRRGAGIWHDGWQEDIGWQTIYLHALSFQSQTGDLFVRTGTWIPAGSLKQGTAISKSFGHCPSFLFGENAAPWIIPHRE